MKKVLAWAVALALVLSSFTMAFADQTKTSADFSDADQIQYTEAVDVMVATGIINGYPDGTFGPAKTVKRSEMSKMIACIMNGGEDVGDQYKSACPFADSKDHWAAGYIAYCASEHIIDGRSADVFDPEAEVTGTEVAKMALTSLGYDSKIQGYTGETWAANVLKDAKKNKLFDGLDSSFVPGDPCSREAAAQILFNMLKAVEVEYATNTSVSVGDATVAVNSKAEKVTPAESGVKDDNEDGFTNLYEDVFGGKLSMNEEDADGFGNPAHSWSYDDEEVGNYVASPDYEFIAEAADLMAAIEAYDEDLAEDFDQPEQGYPEKAIYGVVVNGGSGSIGIGDTVKMYKTDGPTTDGEPDYPDVEFYEVVVEQYVAVQITDVDTDVSTAEAKKDITAKITVQYGGEEGPAIPDTEFTGYDAESYVKDAVIAVAYNHGRDANKNPILDSYVMEELASGSVSRTYAGTTPDSLASVTMDGTKYDMASAYNPVDGKDVVAGDNEYTLYDYNGYALASVQTAEAEAEVFYGVVTNYAEDVGEDDFGENGVSKVKIVTSEGEETVFTVNKDCKVKPEKGLQKTLVAYTLNEDGEVDSIEPAKESDTPEALTNGTTMKTEGVLAGKAVSSDVVAFWLDPEDEDAEWVVYDFDAMNDEDVKVKADFIKFNGDAEIAAILLTKDLVDESTEATLGFVTKVDPWGAGADGQFADITAFVNGEEVTYTTAKGAYGTEAIDTSLDVWDLAEFTLNADGELTGLKEAAVQTEGVTGPVEEFTEPNVAAAIYDKYVVGKKNNSLNIGTETELDYQAVGSAVIYFIKDNNTLEKSDLSKIKVSNHPGVDLYQTDAAGGAWNIVVFWDDTSVWE